VRLDAARPLADLLAAEYVFSLTFLQPVTRRLEVRGTTDPVITLLAEPEAHPPARDGHGRVSAGTVMELAVPLELLGAKAGDPIAFFVSVTSPGHPGGHDAERYPAQRPIRVLVPGENFSGENWRA
jgi:hypothetical protein